MENALAEQFKGDAAAYLRSLKQTIDAAKRLKSAARRQAWSRWRQMWARCTNEQHHAFHNYGGRGIAIDPAWSDFDTYFADVGNPPRPGMQLDRVDNDGPYSKGNVRWVTPAENGANRRISDPVKITSAGRRWKISVRHSASFSSAAEAEDFAQALRQLLKRGR